MKIKEVIPALIQAGKDAKSNAGFRLSPGVKVEASDRDYIVSQSGAWIRTPRKPWRNKAQKKAMKKAAQVERAFWQNPPPAIAA